MHPKNTQKEQFFHALANVGIAKIKTNNAQLIANLLGAAMRAGIEQIRDGSGRASFAVWSGRLAATVTLTAIAASGALAQVATPPAGAPTREEVERPLPERVEPPRARLEVENLIERAPCALNLPEYQNFRFTLSDVTFESLRGLPAEALRPAYANLVGQSLPVAAICEIRDRAAAILADAGYVSIVEVPEQRIADGQVRFQVVMARLVELRVRGNASGAERLIAGYLQPLTEREVFNRDDAERYLLLAGDLPGYSVRLALRSAARARGEVVGEVIVQRIPALVDLVIQNYGSRELGRWGGMVRAQLFGLSGLGDRTTFAAYSTADRRERQTVQVAHDFRVGAEGLAFGGQLTVAWGRPDLGQPSIDIRSRTIFATLEATYPFVRRQDRTVRGSIGLDYVDQNIDFGAFPLNRDRLRVAFVRLSGEAIGRGDRSRYSAFEPFWRLGATLEARQGLDIFDATDPCGANFAACFGAGIVPPTRLEADPTATVLRSSIDAEIRPAPRLTFAASMRAQYSSDPLLSFEEMSAGNYTIGRGYDPGTILGDRGVAIRAEARFGNAYPRAADRFAIEPFVFVDQAWAWNEERLFVIPRQELTSVGAGARGAYGDALRMELLVAAPLDRTLLQPNRDIRVLLSVTARLWPWSFR